MPIAHRNIYLLQFVLNIFKCFVPLLFDSKKAKCVTHPFRLFMNNTIRPIEFNKVENHQRDSFEL